MSLWLMAGRKTIQAQEQSNISRSALQRQPRRGLAGGSAVNKGGSAPGGLKANYHKECEHRGRSEHDRLQKTDEELRETHSRIMGLKGRVVDVTSRVDLKCPETGPHPDGMEQLRGLAGLHLVSLGENRSGHRTGDMPGQATQLDIEARPQSLAPVTLITAGKFIGEEYCAVPAAGAGIYWLLKTPDFVPTRATAEEGGIVGARRDRQGCAGFLGSMNKCWKRLRRLQIVGSRDSSQGNWPRR